MAAAYDEYLAASASKAAATASGEAQGGGAAVPDGLNVEEPVALLENGQKEGETKFVREGGGVMAYGWSAAKAEWEKIGQVVAGPEGGGGGGGAGGRKVIRLASLCSYGVVPGKGERRVGQGW